MTRPHPRPEWLESATRKEGRYVIGPLLGHGGMGDVHEAWDTVLGRLVALKILTRVEPAAMVRFMHEAQLQARIEHPNICRIYDIHVEGGVPRIAMQLVRGPTLEDASPDLSLVEVATLAAQVAETLRDAHRAGLIHRDVKPGNVLLEWQEQGGWEPILCDFGLAMGVNDSTLTQPNALTGTPAYMAPEQIRGDRGRIGPATDVYGLGGTLYFLLLGRPPCVSTVTQEMLRVKKDQRFPKPRALEPAIPEELEAILLKCLAPAPEDRYPDMEHLARALWGFLGKAPGRAPATRRRRRHGLIAAGAALLAAGLGALLWRHGDSQAHWREWAERAALEAGNLEWAMRSEGVQPPHDTRPARERLRAFKRAVPTLFGPGAEAAEGPRALLLGTADYYLDDPAAAREELARAWTCGCTGANVAYLLGQACADLWMAQAKDSAYRGDRTPAALREEAKAWFQQARGLSLDRSEYATALMAFMDRDLPQAVSHARAAMAANPWRREAASLGAQALVLQAREWLDKGDPGRAAQAYQEALGWTEEALGRAPSDAGLHHARLTAKLGLANLDQEQGALTSGKVDALVRQAEQALAISPDAPLAQGDWLSVQCLKAMHQARLGLDAQETLEEGLAFYWTRTQEPRPPELLAAHMVLYWLVAERESARGRTPDAALAEALKGAGHPLDAPRDYLNDLLKLKAAVEAARPPVVRPARLRGTRQAALPSVSNGRSSLLVPVRAEPRFGSG